MAIYLRDKSWYYDFVHRGQRYTGSFGPVSRTVAKEELARKKAEVVEGRLNSAKARKSPRFAAFADEYLDWVKANRKPLTVDRVAGMLKRLKVSFGQKKLSDLTPWHLEQFKKARKEEGRAPGTINPDVTVLKAMLQKALEWGKLAALGSRTMGICFSSDYAHTPCFMPTLATALWPPASPLCQIPR